MNICQLIQQCVNIYSSVDSLGETRHLFLNRRGTAPRLFCIRYIKRKEVHGTRSTLNPSGRALLQGVITFSACASDSMISPMPPMMPTFT